MDEKNSTLIRIIRNLSAELYDDNLRSDVIIWFLDNMCYDKEFNNYPVLYFVSQEPEFKMWVDLCYYLNNKNFKKLFNEDTRRLIYDDLKIWLIKKIKKNYICGL